MGVKLDATLSVIVDLELIDYGLDVNGAKKLLLKEIGSLDSEDLQVLIKLGLRKLIDEALGEEGLENDETGTIDYDVQTFLHYELSEYKGDK